jgi:hypothetical protein
MELRKLVSEILTNAAKRNKEEAYQDVYFIKVLNPGDRTNLFVSFRWKSSKKEVFICRMDINLSNPNKNVLIALSLLKPKERQSTTFFIKRMFIPHKNIIEIINDDIVPIMVEKLEKVENYYVNE